MLAGMQHAWRPGVNLFNKISEILESSYPETIKTIWVVRAPSAFPVLFALVKPFLAAETREKVKVLGSSFEKVKTARVIVSQDCCWVLSRLGWTPLGGCCFAASSYFVSRRR